MQTQNEWGEVTSLKRRLFKGDLRQKYMGDHILSKDDSKRLSDAYIRLFWMMIDIGQEISQSLDSESLLAFSRNCSQRALSRKIEALARFDTATVFKQFKCLLQALRHLPDNGRGWYYGSKTSYKRSMSNLRIHLTTYDVELQGPVWDLVGPYFRLLWIIDTPEMFRYVNDIVQYISRLTLQDVDWIEDENIEEYVVFEEKLHSQQYDPALLAELREIITRWFKDFDFSSRWADHGYGATAEVNRSKGTAAKYHKMIPTVESALLASRLDWTPHFEVAWKGLTSGYENILRNYFDHEDVLTARDMICKVQLVPKGCDKKRVVSKEPTVHQFYQKMIGSAMSKHFDRHPEMKINLHCQERNRTLAQLGSRNRQYGTIDLSSASDSVTLTLFKSIFRDTPLYDPILWCRTTKAELPDHRIVELEKMSPMGSAVCFPIECSVFSAIIACANKRLGVHTDYCVYGDDLVVDGLIFDEVVYLLKELNFIVNDDKSFPPEAPFKESCGIECYYGVDVSPIRLSRKYDSVAARIESEYIWNPDNHYFTKQSASCKDKMRKRINPTKHDSDKEKEPISLQLDSMYKHGNDAYWRGYSNLRRSFITDTLVLYKVPIFSHSEKYGFLTPTSNICIPNAKMKVVHRYGDVHNVWTNSPGELYVRVLTVRSSIDNGEQHARYSKLLEEYDRTSRTGLYLPEDRIDSFAGSAHSYYKWEWLPTSQLVDYNS